MSRDGGRCRSSLNMKTMFYRLSVFIRVRVGNGCNVIPWARERKRVELFLLNCSWSSSCSVTVLYFLKVVPLQPNPLGMYSKLSCTRSLWLEAARTWVFCKWGGWGQAPVPRAKIRMDHNRTPKAQKRMYFNDFIWFYMIFKCFCDQKINFFYQKMHPK